MGDAVSLYAIVNYPEILWFGQPERHRKRWQVYEAGSYARFTLQDQVVDVKQQTGKVSGKSSVRHVAESNHSRIAPIPIQDTPWCFTSRLPRNS